MHDPQEVLNNALTELARFQRVLDALLTDLDDGAWRARPAPGEWSAHVVVCHLVLNEMNTAMSLRLMLTRDRPSLAEFEDDQWAERFAPLYPDTETALGMWRALREDNLRLCASVSADDRERVGRPSWSGTIVSFRRYVASRGRHDLNHIEQIRVALSC